MSTEDLKAPSTPLNGSSSSVTNRITTTFLLLNIDQIVSLIKNSTQLQSLDMFPDNYSILKVQT